MGCNVPKLGGSRARSQTRSQIANKITGSMDLIAGMARIVDTTLSRAGPNTTRLHECNASDLLGFCDDND